MPPIVCGTDLSPGGAEATAAAVALAALRGDPELIVIHVIEGQDLDTDAARDAAGRAALAKLEAVAAKATAGYPVAIRHVVEIDSPVERLTALADTEGSDLIVIAAQATPHASLYRLGSTAAHVVAGTRSRRNTAVMSGVSTT